MITADIKVAVQFVVAPTPKAAGEQWHWFSHIPVAGAPMHRHIIAIVQHLSAIGANIEAIGDVVIAARCKIMCAGAVSDERCHGRTACAGKPSLLSAPLRLLGCASAPGAPEETNPACAAAHQSPLKGVDWSAAPRTPQKCDSCARLRQLRGFNCRTPTDGIFDGCWCCS